MELNVRETHKTSRLKFLKAFDIFSNEKLNGCIDSSHKVTIYTRQRQNERNSAFIAVLNLKIHSEIFNTLPQSKF